MANLFISYRHSEYNTLIARNMRSYLSSKGHSVFLDEEEIIRGVSWEDTIYTKISNSDILLLILTKDVLQSRWVQREVDFARGSRIKILPVVVEEGLLKKDKDGFSISSITDELAISHIQYAKALEIIGKSEFRYMEIEASIQNLVPMTRKDQEFWIQNLQTKWKEIDKNNFDLQPPYRNPSRTKYVYNNGSRTNRCLIHLAEGDMTNMPGIDVMVNSENSYMQMQRVFADESVSKTLRLGGAHRDGDFKIIDDTIQKELNNKLFKVDENGVPIGGGVPVKIGNVIVTSSGHPTGDLAKTGVKYIFHVSVVEAHIKRGQQKLEDTSVAKDCTHNCFEEIEKLQQNLQNPIKSIIFPIFGSGNAGLNLNEATVAMIKAIQEYLDNHPKTKLQNIHINAYRRADVKIVEALLDEHFQRK